MANGNNQAAVILIETVIGRLTTEPDGALLVPATPVAEQAGRLRRRVDEWARRRGASPATVDAAFGTTTRLLAHHGPSAHRMTALGLAPARISGQALRDADGPLRALGDPELRAACEKIVVCLYELLLPDPPATGRRAPTGTHTQQLTDDVLAYLDALSQHLSAPPPVPGPHGGNASAGPVPELERTLRVVRDPRPEDARTSGERTRPAPEPADDVLATGRHVVVLGEPGSGRTWLARRTARRCADRARELVRAGTPIDAVELPLFLTWARFASTAGQAREAALGPALDLLRLPDGTERRIRTLLRHRNCGVLLVLDSFDETVAGQRRIRQALIGDWRTVVTAQPGAWRDHWGTPGPANPSGDGVFVRAELQDLGYPYQVELFARSWFGDAGAAGRFMTGLEESPAARALSTVPWFLTRLCLLAPDGTLPGPTWHLADRMIAQLLHAPAGTGTGAETGEPLRTARDWAWYWAQDDPASGLSAWPDDVLTSSSPLDQLLPEPAGRLDALVPRTGRAPAGGGRQVRRRFAHRVIREHLVAVTVSRLPLTEAADLLTAHWWFDETWKAVAPTAVSLHPERDELLAVLRRAVATGKKPPLSGALEQQSDAIWLALCRETQPSHWQEPSRRFLHGVRARQGSRWTIALRASAHWGDSNPACVEGLLNELADVHPYGARSTIAALSVLGRDRDVAAAKGVLRQRIEAGSHYLAGGLAIALAHRPAEPEDLRAGLHGVVAALPRASDHDLPELRRALTALVEAGLDLAELARAAQELLAGDGHQLPELFRMLAPLPLPEADRRQLSATLHTRIALAVEELGAPDADSWSSSHHLAQERLAALLHGLAVLPGDEDQASLPGIVATAFPVLSPWEPEQVLRAWAALRPAFLLRYARTVLPHAAPDVIESVAEALSGLENASAERTLAVNCALRAAGSSPAPPVPSLLALGRALVKLDAGPRERRVILDAFVRACPGAGADDLSPLAHVSRKLGATPEDQRAFAGAIGSRLRSADPAQSSGLGRALSELEISPAQWRDLVHPVCSAVPLAYASWGFARALAQARLSPDAERLARSTLLEALSRTRDDGVPDMLGALAGWGLSPDEVTSVVGVVRRRIPQISATSLPLLARSFVRLPTTVDDRRPLLAFLTGQLEGATPHGLPDLVTALGTLAVTLPEQEEVADVVTRRAVPRLGTGQERQHLMDAVQALAAHDAVRRLMVARLLIRLRLSDDPSPWVAVLRVLVRGDDEGAAAVEAVRDRMAGPEPSRVLSSLAPLMEALPHFATTPPARRSALQAIADAARRPGEDRHHLIRSCLAALAGTDEEHAVAAGVLRGLHGVDDLHAPWILEALRAHSSPRDWADWLEA
ncbi:hypothetical protein KIH74_30290 [Kineosporia sp. J2-2]|uniref:NACHT domain-containing protein n=1 Tax=Kineosporia corallincola TaxID=2835133 RepID=A0ABS5TQN2_9ACTN|nr:hypothetical protein [Kineosporia corallincola]MBT0773273.1 hypothetical protein [Kineosporia corallincola]